MSKSGDLKGELSMRTIGLTAVFLTLAGCATTGATNGALGSEANPVRADMPPGEQAYLNRLRCSDGKPPVFSRIGSMGIQHSSHVIDGFDVTCSSGQPAKTTIYIDMYHPGHVESQPVEGFTIVP